MAGLSVAPLGAESDPISANRAAGATRATAGSAELHADSTSARPPKSARTTDPHLVRLTSSCAAAIPIERGGAAAATLTWPAAPTAVRRPQRVGPGARGSAGRSRRAHGPRHRGTRKAAHRRRQWGPLRTGTSRRAPGAAHGTEGARAAAHGMLHTDRQFPQACCCTRRGPSHATACAARGSGPHNVKLCCGRFHNCGLAATADPKVQ